MQALRPPATAAQCAAASTSRAPARACSGATWGRGAGRATHGCAVGSARMARLCGRATPGSGGELAEVVEELPLPSSPQQQVAQAAAALVRARQRGVNLAVLELQLPLIGRTDLDDWPGGIRQQFKAAKPLVEQLLKTLVPEAAVEQRVIDDADAVVELRAGDATALVFPTAETFDDVERLAGGARTGPGVLVNPQWQNEGQLISDFGFGPWRKAKEDVVAKFTEVYSVRELRIRGQVVRVLRAYPRPWTLFALGGGPGSGMAPTAPVRMTSFERRPTYKEVEDAITAGLRDSIANADWAQRAASEWRFNQESMKQPPKD